MKLYLIVSAIVLASVAASTAASAGPAEVTFMTQEFRVASVGDPDGVNIVMSPGSKICGSMRIEDASGNMLLETSGKPDVCSVVGTKRD